MNKGSWLIALVALVLGAAVAVAITRGAEDETTVAAPPSETTDTEKSGKSDSKGSSEEQDDKAADDEETAEQQVEQTVNAYVDALEAGDTEALCNIQAESFTVKVTASGVSGEEIAAACAEAAEQFDWAELWADWASQIDLDALQVHVDGGQANVSVARGASFSLDRQKSGEWKVDGLSLPGLGGTRATPAGDGGRPSGGTLPSGGGVPSGGSPPSGGGVPSGGAELPSPQIPQSPQLPQSPQVPRR